MVLFQRTIEPCRKAVSDAKLATTDIDEVVLVGGSTVGTPRSRNWYEDILERAAQGRQPGRSGFPWGSGSGRRSSGEARCVLLDVTPLSLGVETLGDVMTGIGERNTTVPIKRREVFSTAADSQTTVEVHVLQGERAVARTTGPLAGSICRSPGGAPRAASDSR